MSVLVTGGAGYIGSHMAWRLLDGGENVVVVDNLSKGHDWAVPPSADFVVADIGDEATMREIIRSRSVDAVIHFAGSILVPESVADPLFYYDNNTSRSRSLFQAALREGVRHIIFSSTAAVYGSPGPNLVTEMTPTRPESPYGSSKLMTETMLRDLSQAAGTGVGILRYFNVAGADPKGRAGQSSKVATHLVKIACEVAVGRRDKLEIYGTDYPTPDGTCVRDYIHVSDLVEAHALMLSYLRAGGENLTANCGYGRGYSVREVLAAAEAVIGRVLPTTEGRRRPGDAVSIVADPALLARTLGWQAAHDDLSTIVRDALAWERRLLGRAAFQAAQRETGCSTGMEEEGRPWTP